MANKYDNIPLNIILDRIKNKDIFANTAEVICSMRETVTWSKFFYIPSDCMSDMPYVIAAINYIITPFGYKASWDWLHDVDVIGNYCIHLFLDEI